MAEPTKKAEAKEQSRNYAKKRDCGVLSWYDKERDIFLCDVRLDEIFNFTWRPYHEVKEIRPEKAGELWEKDNGSPGNIWVSFKIDSTRVLRFKHTTTGGEVVLEEGFHKHEVVHNKNGWKLLYSPDKEVMERIKEVGDPSFKRIRIKDVTWHKGRGNGVSIVFPIADNSSEGSAEVGKDLLACGPMTMILEMSKDKP